MRRPQAHRRHETSRRVHRAVVAALQAAIVRRGLGRSRPCDAQRTSAQAPPKQAVVETTAGTFVIDLTPETAPNQTAYFMKLAAEGGVRRDDLSPRGEVRHGAGRRSADEGSGEARAVRHRRAERGQGRSARAEDDARIGGGGARPGQARQRRRAVLHRARRSAGARQPVHRVRPGVGRHRGAAEDFRDAGRRQGHGDRAHRDHGTSRFATRPPEPFVTETPQELGAYRAVLDTSAGPITIEFFTDKAPEHRPPVHAAGGGRASTTAWRSTASRRGSSFRPARSSSRAGAAHREAAEARAQPAAGVQRHQAREGDRLDGARRRARQRDDVVLHLSPGRRARSTASTRRSAASSTAWRRSRRSRRRRGTARRRRRGSS